MCCHDEIGWEGTCVTGQSTPQEAIRAAIGLAGHAPSLFNAQPWSWRAGADSAELFLDTTQSYPVTDPQQREMRIGCGAVLHHLLVALAAAGWRCEVERRSGRDGGSLALVRVTEADEPDQDALRLVEAIPNRHNDRRPFSAEPVSQDALAALQASADGEGVHLQVVTRDEHQIWLSVLTERAAALQGAEAGYADELARATGANDTSVGVRADAIPHVVSPRHSDVTLRDFELLDPGSLEIPESADEHPIWCVLWTERDAPENWLRAGEALSRVLLNATEQGLATGVQSQPVEVPMIRAQINEHLLSGLGHAQVLVRIGWSGSPDSELPPPSPRQG